MKTFKLVWVHINTYLLTTQAMSLPSNVALKNKMM